MPTLSPPGGPALSRRPGPTAVGPTFFAELFQPTIFPPAAAVSPYSRAVLADNPLAYLRMGARGGTIEPDASGNGHNGRYTGGFGLTQPGALASDTDTSVLFTSGSQSLLTLNTLGAFGSSLSNSSIEFGINTTSSTQQYVLGVVNAGTTMRYEVELNTTTSGALSAGRTVLFVRGSAGAAQRQALPTTPNIYDGKWHHVVFTMAGTASSCTLKGYVDGNPIVLVITTNPFNFGSFANFTPNVTIGAQNNNGAVGTYIDATLDEIAFYASTLSAAQVANHYQAGARPGVGFFDLMAA